MSSLSRHTSGPTLASDALLDTELQLDIELAWERVSEVEVEEGSEGG